MDCVMYLLVEIYNTFENNTVQLWYWSFTRQNTVKRPLVHTHTHTCTRTLTWSQQSLEIHQKTQNGSNKPIRQFSLLRYGFCVAILVRVKLAEGTPPSRNNVHLNQGRGRGGPRLISWNITRREGSNCDLPDAPTRLISWNFIRVCGGGPSNNILKYYSRGGPQLRQPAARGKGAQTSLMPSLE